MRRAKELLCRLQQTFEVRVFDLADSGDRRDSVEPIKGGTFWQAPGLSHASD